MDYKEWFAKFGISVSYEPMANIRPFRLSSFFLYSYLKNMDGSNFTQDSLMSGKATIFLYFNTDCDFCQNEIKSIREYMNLFRKASLILISPEPIEDIIKFIDSNNLSTQDNIKFLQDPILDFASKFDATIIPYTIVYNKDKQLIKRSKGQIKAEVILNLLNNEN